jgi:hypothetical protein
MNEGQEGRQTWQSRVILIDETSTLVIDDTVRIMFRHRPSFRLLWNVCKAITENPKYAHLGGVPPEGVEEEYRRQEIPPSRNAINMRWRDEIEFRGSMGDEPAEYAATVRKCIDITLMRDGMLPPQMTKEAFAVETLRSVFTRLKPPAGTDVHHNTDLFSVRAAPDAIRLFPTQAHAEMEGIRASGISELTKFRIAPWDIGFLHRKQEIVVHPGSNAEALVSLAIANLSVYPLVRYSFPLWTWPNPLSSEPSPAKAWLSDHTELYTTFNVRDARGYTTAFLDVFFPTSIMPGDHLKFSYRYVHPRSISTGENIYLVYVDNPHRLYQLEVRVEEGFSIGNPTVFVGQRQPEAIQPVQHSKSSFVWSRPFPAPRIQYEVVFQLSDALHKQQQQA